MNLFGNKKSINNKLLFFNKKQKMLIKIKEKNTERKKN